MKHTHNAEWWFEHAAFLSDSREYAASAEALSMAKLLSEQREQVDSPQNIFE